MIRSALWRCLRWFLFRLDAETAHRLTLSLIHLGSRLRGVPLRVASGASPERRGAAPVLVWQLPFSSRVGLAAGFDKDAEILAALPALGFGFAEIGTVTPRPQPGNDRPRLFRDPSRRAIFNRMGFNGLGAEIVARRLTHARMGGAVPSSFRVGVNVGKNKDTPAAEAHRDYLSAAAKFVDISDYLVINVSSPNTPGLRAFQTVEALRPIIQAVAEEVKGRRPDLPLLLKLAPEIRGEALAGIIPAAEGWGIDGWVLTNTWAGEIQAGGATLSGGWSGGPLTDAARAALVEARSLTRKPIISVGGILSAEEARARIQAGAELVQLYTGWIYGGPSFPALVSAQISQEKRP
jgi:dihydroorotate dehydrogenase